MKNNPILLWLSLALLWLITAVLMMFACFYAENKIIADKMASYELPLIAPGMIELQTALGGGDEDSLNDLMYSYYLAGNGTNKHYDEFCFMPNFAYGEQPSWDEASFWLSCLAEYNPTTNSWSAAEFQALAKILLPDYNMPQENSAYVTYDAETDCFICSYPTDIETTEFEYYHFDGYSINGHLKTQGIFRTMAYEYQLHFSVYPVDENWYTENNNSPNSAALRAYGQHFGYTDENMYELDVVTALHDILTNRNIPDETGKILRLKEYEKPQAASRAYITCRLSGDERLPFTYLAAEREIMF